MNKDIEDIIPVGKRFIRAAPYEDAGAFFRKRFDGLKLREKDFLTEGNVGERCSGVLLQLLRVVRDAGADAEGGD